MATLPEVCILPGEDLYASYNMIIRLDHLSDLFPALTVACQQKCAAKHTMLVWPKVVLA